MDERTDYHKIFGNQDGAEPVEEVADELVEEPVEEVIDEPVEEVADESVEEPVEELILEDEPKEAEEIALVEDSPSTFMRSNTGGRRLRLRGEANVESLEIGTIQPTERLRVIDDSHAEFIFVEIADGQQVGKRGYVMREYVTGE